MLDFAKNYLDETYIVYIINSNNYLFVNYIIHDLSKTQSIHGIFLFPLSNHDCLDPPV